MTDWIKWAAAGTLLRLAGRPERNRARFYDGAHGLRILTLHAMSGREVDHFRRIVDWCAERYEIVGPEAADRLFEGRLEPAARDRVLFTFDDGHERDFPVAEWLAQRGIHGIFFVIPSYVGRTVREFLAYHDERGIEAYDIAGGEDPDRVHGLAPTQIREMAGMGHRIAAHNHAHRDLGHLHRDEDFEYEIGRARETLSELLGVPCDDFAWAFGHARHLSAEAAEYLLRHVPRVYACVRGLNVPGLTPRFAVRDNLYTNGPRVASKLFIEGGGDDRWTRERTELLSCAGALPAWGVTP